MGRRRRGVRRALLGKPASFAGTQWAADHGCGRGAQTPPLPEPVFVSRSSWGQGTASCGKEAVRQRAWSSEGALSVLGRAWAREGALSVCPGARAGPLRVLCLSWGKRGPHEGILSVLGRAWAREGALSICPGARCEGILSVRLSWVEHGSVRVLCLSVCPGVSVGPVRVLSPSVCPGAGQLPAGVPILSAMSP